MEDKINKKKIAAVLIFIGVIFAINTGFKIYQMKRINEKYFHVSYNDLDDVDIDSYGQIGTSACNIEIYLKNDTRISIDDYIGVWVYKKDESYYFNAQNKYLKDLMKVYIKDLE